jgi:hypothetical protein
MPTSVTRLTNTGTLLASSNFDEVTYALQNPATTNVLRNTNGLGPLGANAVSNISGTWVGYCNSGTATNVTYNTTDFAAPDGSYTATRIVRDNVASCGANTNGWGLLTTAAGVFTAGTCGLTSSKFSLIFFFSILTLVIPLLVSTKLPSLTGFIAITSGVLVLSIVSK